MTYSRLHFAFLNIGHFLDHFFMLVFASVAALTLTREWGLSYAQLIPYATPGFIAFGAFALPAGRLADKWSRRGMMAVFFIGIGVSSTLTALAETPFQIGLALFLMGVFAAIYHPVGLPLVIEGRDKTGMPIAVNGVFGNLGVASAALLTGFMIDTAGWREAFVWPGAASIALGLAYIWIIARAPRPAPAVTSAPAKGASAQRPAYDGALLVRIFTIIIITTALGGVVFQSLYSEDAIPVLPQLLANVEAGDTYELSVLLSSFLANGEFVSMGMMLSVQCHEESGFSSPAIVETALDAYPELETIFEGSPNVGPAFFDLCSDWGTRQAPPLENEPVSSDIPTLILAGEYDPITPPLWGRLVAESLLQSAYVEFPGQGHGPTTGASTIRVGHRIRAVSLRWTRRPS